MNRNDALQIDDPQLQPSYRVPAVGLDDLRTPLAVILARAQLLERRILQGARLAPDDYLEVVSAIERSVWELERQLRVLQQEAHEAQRDG